MPATVNVSAFVAKWKAASLTERAASQSHFIDICRLLGQDEPTSDPTGKDYAFEKGATKATGGDGWADVWRRHCFGWEYKRGHANLDAAYKQLLLYKGDLANPPLLVVCDTDRFVVYTDFTDTPTDRIEFRLADLESDEPLPGRKYTAMQALRALFVQPELLRPERTVDEVTTEAAAKFATLADSLRAAGVDPEKAAHFLMRLLFCLFAEDTGLLPERLFSQLVDATKTRPMEFRHRLALLFTAMADGSSFGWQDIRWFNGGLFKGAETEALNTADMTVLAEACQMDWRNVEPAIFGTLFERSLDPAKRAQLGAHYTSRSDIELVVEPVLMAPLRRDWEQTRAQVEGLLTELESAKTARRRSELTGEAQKLLRECEGRIAAVKVLDPACGSGNFLYVALRSLLQLEKQVDAFGATRQMLPFAATPQVGPQQLLGIEVNPYARELAQVVVWIGFLQWLQSNGYEYPENPVLKELDSIRLMDAVLAHDAAGKPVEPEWPESDVIIGNPPFLGDKRMRSELGDAYVDKLRRFYKGRVPGGADLVCYWFERARAQIAAGRAKRAGLLATNSIRQPANRLVLKRVKEKGDIFWAWADRPWVLDGAAVRVSMVGFDTGEETERKLDGKSVAAINSDLTASADLTTAHPLQENHGIGFIGDTKKGQFDIDRSVAEPMLSAPVNQNGRPNSDVIVPWVNGRDVTDRPRGMYIIDFGTAMPQCDAARYEAPYQYVFAVVKPFRDKVRNPTERRLWWLHARPGPDLRTALKPLSRYIGTSIVAKYRLFVWLEASTLPDHRLCVFAREDDYALGVLHSRPHELWSLRRGSTLEDRPSYSASECFETYPFPWPPRKEPAGDRRVEAIAAAAKELVRLRDKWLNEPGLSDEQLKLRTLTKLYNERPPWLADAHEKLDRAVFAAYGWPWPLCDEEVLERLLALNHARAGR